MKRPLSQDSIHVNVKAVGTGAGWLRRAGKGRSGRAGRVGLPTHV